MKRWTLRTDLSFMGERNLTGMTTHKNGQYLERAEVIDTLAQLKTWSPDTDRFGPCVSLDDTGALCFLDDVLNALGIERHELTASAIALEDE